MFHEGRVIDPSYLGDQPNLRPTFTAIGFDCLLDINEKMFPVFVLQFYKSVRLIRSLNGTLSITFSIQIVEITLRLEEFSRILRIPYRGCKVVVGGGMERGFLSQKGSGGGRGVKEKDINRNKKNISSEKQNSWEDTTVLGSFPPLSIPGTTTVGNAPGKSSYAKVTGKPSGKKLNFHTLFTPRGNGIDVVVPVESIRAINERFANTTYGFSWERRWHTLLLLTMFRTLGGRSSYARAIIELRADVELKDNIIVAMPKLTREGVLVSEFYVCRSQAEARESCLSLYQSSAVKHCQPNPIPLVPL
ncbi:hypothetical protein Tco_1285243 [Tanacetum coccineum]